MTPKASENCWGHESIEAQILASLQQGKLPHGLLFRGLRGIGKATFAYRLVRFLFTHGKAPPSSIVSLDTPPQSSVFRRILSGGHADLCVLERMVAKDGTQAKHITVDDVRRAIHFMRKTPAEGGWRIVIVDGAESLNKNGANALLKLLEEPPPYGLVILIADSLGGLPMTVLSRCQQFLFQAPDPDVGIQILQSLTPQLPSQNLLNLAHASPGLALALQAADGVGLYTKLLHFLKMTLDHQGVRAIMGLQKAFDGNAAGFDLWLSLYREFIGKIIEFHAFPTQAFSSLEQSVFDQCVKRPLVEWVDTWQHSIEFIRAAQTFHLDWRQVLEGMVNIFEQKVRG